MVPFLTRPIFLHSQFRRWGVPTPSWEATSLEKTSPTWAQPPPFTTFMSNPAPWPFALRPGQSSLKSSFSSTCLLLFVAFCEFVAFCSPFAFQTPAFRVAGSSVRGRPFRITLYTISALRFRRAFTCCGLLQFATVA